MSATTRIKDCLVVVLLCGNVFGQNDMSVPTAAEVVAVVQKHFHSRCVSIVQRTDDTDMGKPDVLSHVKFRAQTDMLCLQFTTHAVGRTCRYGVATYRKF